VCTCALCLSLISILVVQDFLDLVKRMRKGAQPVTLLGHPFFSPLREMPSSFSKERCVAVSDEVYSLKLD